MTATAPALANRLAEMVGIVGGIGQHRGGPILVERGRGMGRIAAMAGGQDEPDGAAQAAHRQVKLGAQAATGAAKGLIFRPPFSPPRRAGGRG